MGVEDSLLKVPVELGDAGHQVRIASQAIVDQLAALAGKLAPLQETWNDPGFGASTYFQGLEQYWNNAAHGLFGDGEKEPGILGDIAHRLDVMWYNYVTTQQTNTKQWMMG
jgi:hypothetical protein